MWFYTLPELLIIAAVIAVYYVRKSYINSNIKEKLGYCTDNLNNYKTILRLQHLEGVQNKYHFTNDEQRDAIKSIIDIYSGYMVKQYTEDHLRCSSSHLKLTPYQYFLITFYRFLSKYEDRRSIEKLDLSHYKSGELVLTEAGLAYYKAFMYLSFEMNAAKNKERLQKCEPYLYDFSSSISRILDANET